ncbi:MAG: hypothetical protein A2085_08635 [Gemmatimonadetes bacterium GWC2_71_10]|nr:MAG: hypothetical protein A2085_08635 [Gemmatimonadetes bacterium GWC2_71_10]
MAFVGDLWQPILLSAALVFIWSAVSWTLLPWHNAEWKGLPNHDAVRTAIKTAGFAAGLYMFPWVDDPKARRSPEAMAKFAEGPSGMVTLLQPGPMSMGGMMTKSLLFNLIVSVFVAYVVSHAFGANLATASYGSVFRIAGCVAFMSYAFGTVPDSIWFGKPWKSWLLVAVDAVIFALLVGGTFAGLGR